MDETKIQVTVDYGDLQHLRFLKGFMEFLAKRDAIIMPPIPKPLEITQTTIKIRPQDEEVCLALSHYMLYLKRSQIAYDVEKADEEYRKKQELTEQNRKRYFSSIRNRK